MWSFLRLGLLVLSVSSPMMFWSSGVFLFLVSLVVLVMGVGVWAVSSSLFSCLSVFVVCPLLVGCPSFSFLGIIILIGGLLSMVFLPSATVSMAWLLFGFGGVIDLFLISTLTFAFFVPIVLFLVVTCFC